MAYVRKVRIEQNKCAGCGACIQNCPNNAILMLSGWHAKIEEQKCTGCGKCMKICHKHAPVYVP